MKNKRHEAIQEANPASEPNDEWKMVHLGAVSDANENESSTIAETVNLQPQRCCVRVKIGGAETSAKDAAGELEVVMDSMASLSDEYAELSKHAISTAAALLQNDGEKRLAAGAVNTPEDQKVRASNDDATTSAVTLQGQKKQTAVMASPATKIVQIVDEHAEGYYRDLASTPYVRLRLDSKCELLSLHDERLRDLLSDEYYRRHGQVPTQSAISNALPLLRKRCRSACASEVFLRMGAINDTIYIDHRLNDETALAVSARGVSETPLPQGLLFRRSSHMLPYGDIDLTAGPKDVWEIFNAVNMPENEDQRLLFLVWMISGFIPGMARPLLVLTGPQGTAKTTTFRYLREILDPSSSGTMAMPRSENDLSLVFNSSYFAPFDNVSALGTLSDSLCRVVTGESISKRKLYTDQSLISFTYQRLAAINGIDIPMTQSDLLDRVVWLQFGDIEPTQRRTLRKVDDLFRGLRPRVVGSCLNAVAQAMAQPEIEVTVLPRLADWATSGAKIAAAIGKKPEHFLAAYSEAIATNRNAAVQSSSFITIIAELLKEHCTELWQVQPLALLRMANEMADQHRLRRSTDKSWPKTTAELVNGLRRAAIDLKSKGFSVETGCQSARSISKIEFTKTAAMARVQRKRQKTA